MAAVVACEHRPDPILVLNLAVIGVGSRCVLLQAVLAHLIILLGILGHLRVAANRQLGLPSPHARRAFHHLVPYFRLLLCPLCCFPLLLLLLPDSLLDDVLVRGLLHNDQPYVVDEEIADQENSQGVHEYQDVCQHVENFKVFVALVVRKMRQDVPQGEANDV